MNQIESGISFVVPVLNESKLLERLLKKLDYITKNKILNSEIIISDGGSKDNSTEIAARYNATIVRNMGESENIAIGRNRGGQLSKGKYIVFINADTDIFDPDYFAEQLINISDKSEFHAVAVKVNVHPDEKKLKDKIFYFGINLYFQFSNFMRQPLSRGECQIIKKNSFDLVGGYNTKLAAGEDVDLFRRISKIGKVIFRKDIIVLESPRRFRNYGYIRTLFLWFLNDMWTRLFSKSFSKAWKEVR